MALTTGARKGELMAMRWVDIDFERSEAHVGVTKNGDPRVLPLVPAVTEQLLQFKGASSAPVYESPRFKGKPYAFEAVYVQAMKAASVKGATFHALRHTCASMLAKNGATLLEIGDVLGHRQMQVTKRYSHLTTGHKAALVQRILGDVR